MKEHIFALNDDGGLEERREEVVRCRDCVNAAEGGRMCMMFAFKLGNGAVVPPDVDPNGFCAWGERKEES